MVDTRYYRTIKKYYRVFHCATFQLPWSTSNSSTAVEPCVPSISLRFGYKFYFYKRSNHTEYFRAVKINHKNLVMQAHAYSQLPLSH